jgi:hypothetical protein
MLGLLRAAAPLPSRYDVVHELRTSCGVGMSAEERDRTDLGLSPQVPDPALRPCEGGWRGEDGAGNLIPCLICRPHLRPRAGGGWKVTRPIDPKEHHPR